MVIVDANVFLFALDMDDVICTLGGNKGVDTAMDTALCISSIFP